MKSPAKWNAFRSVNSCSTQLVPVNCKWNLYIFRKKSTYRVLPNSIVFFPNTIRTIFCVLKYRMNILKMYKIK